MKFFAYSKNAPDRDGPQEILVRSIRRVITVGKGIVRFLITISLCGDGFCLGLRVISHQGVILAPGMEQEFLSMKRMVARLRTASVAVGALALMALPALAQQAQNPGVAGPGPGPGGHVGPGPGGWHHAFMQHMAMVHHHMHHPHPGMMVVGVLMTVFALIGLIAVIVLVGRLIRGGGCLAHRSRASLEILEGRYARSEINHDEFVEKKRDLLSRR
jgi:uncharacterized membrane protein